MECLMPSHASVLVSDFRETNRRLRFWLDQLLASSTEPTSRTATPAQMTGLLAELMRAGERLRALPAGRDAALEPELALYRQHVERLRDLLPTIHATLLEERARLEQERQRLASAAEWAERSRQTL